MSASQGKDKDVGDITADLMDVFSSPKGGKSQESFSLQKQVTQRIATSGSKVSLVETWLSFPFLE